MRIVEPKVYVLAETKPVQANIQSYLDSLENELGMQWIMDHSNPGLEEIEEFAGRLCYNSFKPGLNPNVTSIRSGIRDYLKNLLEQHHGSVLEHPSVTFLFTNVSRVLTHELVRHRAGMAFSQESLRYVRLTDIGFWWPSVFRDDPNTERRKMVMSRGTWLIEQIEEFIKDISAAYTLDDCKDFGRKKEVTSAMRRFIPMGMTTAIMWTANIRALRHLITMRTSVHAEEEIRILFGKVAEIATSRWPQSFQDFDKQDDGSWVPKNMKV